jgi:hypothetical protein
LITDCLTLKASVYIKAGMSAAILVQGTQTLNNNVINLKKEEDFDTVLFSNQIGVFCHTQFQKTFRFIHVRRKFRYGFRMSELKISSNNIGFGLLIDISKKQEIVKQ